MKITKKILSLGLMAGLTVAMTTGCVNPNAPTQEEFKATQTVVASLEKELTELKDTESIKKLKGEYLRYLDTKNWEGMEALFTDDIVTSYSDGANSYTGKEEVINFFKNNMPATLISQHQTHTPEITIIDEDTAEAIWYLEDYLILQDFDMSVQGTAFYHSQYRKVNGEWLINEIGYNRVFEEEWTRSKTEERTITQNMHKETESEVLVEVDAETNDIKVDVEVPEVEVESPEVEVEKTI